MAYFACFIFILLEIIGTLHASNPRSVNVALETVLEFDSKDDIEFIETMQNFLNKVKTTIIRNRAVYDTEKSNDAKEHFIFTDFLADTVNVLKAYEDKDLKLFFKTLEKEMKTWQTRKEFHEITDKLGFRRLIDRNLQSLKYSPVIEIRRKLGKLYDQLKGANRNGDGFVADFLNYIYKKESEANLVSFLNNLKLYRTRTRRNNMTDLSEIIGNGILSLIDPLLKLKPKTIVNISKIFYKYFANNGTKYVNDLLINDKIRKVKTKISGQKHKFQNILNDSDVLDYIEDHIKVIDEHFTKKDVAIIGKSKSIPRWFINVGTTKKRKIRPKNNRKLKIKGNSGKLNIRPREKKKPKLIKNTTETYDYNNDDRKPVLIKLARNDNTELKSVEQYMSSTKPQKRYKKSTRPKLTPKRSINVYKTTKKYRKAFRTSTLSAEGLSIEHFGSLFGREFHRKSNDNDTFGQDVFNSTLTTVLNDSITNTEASEVLSKEIRRSNNLSRENEEHFTEHDDTKIVSDNTEDNKNIELEEKHDIVTESIKIKGNIFIESPTEATTLSQVEITTSTPVKTTAYRHYNVSIVTKYFNVQTLKPTIVLRSHDKESNEINEANTSTAPQISFQTNVTANESETDNVIKPTNALENEIEDIMDIYNNTPVPVELQNLINKIEDNAEDSKVRDQMKADLAKILAPPSTKRTVTQLFTDPFDDIDDGADIL